MRRRTTPQMPARRPSGDPPSDRVLLNILFKNNIIINELIIIGQRRPLPLGNKRTPAYPLMIADRLFRQQKPDHRKVAVTKKTNKR